MKEVMKLSESSTMRNDAEVVACRGSVLHAPDRHFQNVRN